MSINRSGSLVFPERRGSFLLTLKTEVVTALANEK